MPRSTSQAVKGNARGPNLQTSSGVFELGLCQKRKRSGVTAMTDGQSFDYEITPQPLPLPTR